MQNATVQLNSIPNEVLQQSFLQWKEHMRSVYCPKELRGLIHTVPGYHALST